jgi:hypothetical protein
MTSSSVVGSSRIRNGQLAALETPPNSGAARKLTTRNKALCFGKNVRHVTLRLQGHIDYVVTARGQNLKLTPENPLVSL